MSDAQKLSSEAGRFVRKAAEDNKFSTGAIRSADADKFSFTSLPMIGLLALARTAGEGAEKYGRFNYLQGMPLHDLLEHVFKHLVMFNAGDRSETHLAHAAWGLLVAIQEEVLRPEAHTPHMLGPGCSITPAMQSHIDEQRPILAANRADRGPDSFTWNIFDLPDVQKLRGQRDAVNATIAQLKSNEAERKSDSREPMVFGQWSSGAYEKSSGNPAVDAFSDRCCVAHTYASGKNDFPAPDAETLAEWCLRNPMSSDAIKADTLGLAGTGCPEPFATLAKDFAPGSTNSKVFGQALRTEPAAGKPEPRPGETWIEYDDGTRAYYPKDRHRTPSHAPMHSHSPLATKGQNEASPSIPRVDTAKSSPGGYFPRS